MSICLYDNGCVPGSSVDIHIKSRTCVECGFVWEGGDLTGKFLGHRRIFGEMADEVELDSGQEAICPSCGNLCNAIFSPCGNDSWADQLFVVQQETVNIRNGG